MNRTYVGDLGDLGDIAGSNPATGTARYYTHDHLLSVRGVYDASKNALGTFEYTPYGSPYHDNGPADVTHRFTGHDLDAITGNYFAPYRYLNPSAGRWMSMDPLGIVDGPNMYAYAGQNPTNFQDPSGLWSMSRKQCRKRIKDKVKDFDTKCKCSTGNNGIDVTAKLGGTPKPRTGWSPREGHVRIPRSWCDLNDRRFDWHVAHEHGHAQDSFSRFKYPFSKKFRDRKEDEADIYAEQCVGYPKPQ